MGMLNAENSEMNHVICYAYQHELWNVFNENEYQVINNKSIGLHESANV